jgi:hypothetical protein
MLKFNNTHIFTGYLKQKLSAINLPVCKIYTREFAEHLSRYGKEDPRVIESINTVDYRTSSDDTNIRPATRVNYLKNNEIYHYLWNYADYNMKADLGHSSLTWKRSSNYFYDSLKKTPGLTKSLYSPGRAYDAATHEYLGEYLRFLRDYHDINLLPLYNCFNNSIYNNLTLELTINPTADVQQQCKAIFNSHDPNYKIYAIPVKLFANYTIAIDCYQDIEIFCGLYNTSLELSDKTRALMSKTYERRRGSMFKQPFLYDKLDVQFWKYEHELTINKQNQTCLNNKTISRWDIANREQDLKLFIKIPASCKSSITILEGDYRTYNNVRYVPAKVSTVDPALQWEYQQNHAVLNFDLTSAVENVDLNDTSFSPISKLQLLAFNTGESYPFADRLIEYLCDSAITPIDKVSDNIKRAQRVMRDNNNHFKIEGVWENKMQKILYDYMINSRHKAKSTLYDTLGYVDKDTEKWYTSWRRPGVKNSIQTVDIYDGLFDI